MTITAEQAAKLREPFPDSAIGQLPKPKTRDAKPGACNVCGGWHGLPAVHLDYVGHAATTDRLLAVDPAWSWEPFALDERGLPALDREGNLWIRLTVCGITRPGVGDGKSLKEKIGDAIRNAAMRFGVALDLWAKEDLHETRGVIEDGEQAPAAPRKKTAAKKAPAPVSTLPQGQPRAAETDEQQKRTRRAMALFSELGYKDDARHAKTSSIIGREVGSWKDVTEDERDQVIATLALERRRDPVVPDNIPPHPGDAA